VEDEPPGRRPAPAAPPVLEVSLLDILVLLNRHHRLLLAATLGALVLGYLVALLLPVRYTATTVLLPPQQNTSFSSSLMSQLQGLSSLAGMGSGSLGIKNPNDLYVGLMKSDTVEDAMVRRFNLLGKYRVKRLSDARSRLEGRVKIDGSGKDGLIRLSMKGDSPQEAADMANGYVDEFRRLSASLAISEAAQRRRFLEEQLQTTKENLARAEEQLKTVEQNTGVIAVDSQARALIETAAALRAQIVAKEVQIQSMETYAGAGNTDLLQARQELAGLKQQLERLGGAGAGEDLIPAKGKLTQAGLAYVRGLREVKYNETIFEILARQYEAARLDEAREGAMIQVVDRAGPPDRKSWPPRMLIGIGCGLLAFLAASAWVCLGAAIRYLEGFPEYAAKLDQLPGVGLIRRYSRA
jgi:uncharacterized protein involved in exopolysaccharide biosynthesis